MKSVLRLSVLFIMFLFLFSEVILPQSIRINEFMASNSVTIKDPDYNDFADWIELFNYGNDTLNLKGFSITDNFSQPLKYKFTTDIIFPPNSFLIIWADDRGVGKHANFKLSASGEKIAIYNQNVQLIDSVSFGEQQNDISMGRFPDGANNWFLFQPASPGNENPESGIYNRLSMPQISHPRGFYSNSVNITISHTDPNAVIRYTLDGNSPDKTSAVYSNPVTIDSNKVLKVRAYKDGILPSHILTSSYFINEATQLPVVSLSTDPANFFSDTSGIYVAGTNGIIGNCSTEPRNWNQEWERPIEIELFEKNRMAGFNVSAGVQIYGGCSRLYAMKSLGFYFRGKYGFGKLDYKLFPDRNLEEYNNFILRSSGQDWWRTMFRDGMVQTLAKQNTKLALQSYRPVTVFINGKYWGIHNLREKLNEHYIESHYKVNTDSIDLVELSKGVSANNGDLVHYNNMISFFTNNSIVNSTNYNYVKSIIDIDDYIDYNSVQIYSANGDWPGSNVKLWRERKSTGKWRWMLYDLDFTFGGNSQGQYNTNTIAQATATNGPDWPNPPWSTLILRKLLENSDFRNEFVQRFAAHINTTFNTWHVIEVIDSISQLISGEIARHKLRWPQSISLGNDWLVNIKVLKDFSVKRPEAIRNFFVTKFNLAGTCSIKIGKSIESAGKVFTNTLEVKNNDSMNVFFKNIPLRLKAVPNAGYRFSHWEGISSLTSEEIVVIPNSNGMIKAVFELVVSGMNDFENKREFRLFQNYPNPFNPSTVISYEIPEDGLVTIKVFDILGREVKELLNENKESGQHQIVFNAEGLTNGVYFASISSGVFRSTIKMVLMK